MNMDYRSLDIVGTVWIEPTFSLAETAARLGEALNVAFTEDSPGTFDEFPSYSAQCAGLGFALLGIPDLADQVSEEPIANYELQIGMEFQTEEATETCDASEYFMNLLSQRSDLRLARS